MHRALAFLACVAGHGSSYWVYLLASVLGGALAEGCYRLLNPQDFRVRNILPVEILQKTLFADRTRCIAHSFGLGSSFLRSALRFLDYRFYAFAPFLAEFLGTWLLCFVYALAHGPLVPLAVGAALAALVYAFEPVSGAHFNPAVTLAVLLRWASSATPGAFTWQRAVGYVAVQLLGATLAAGCAAGAVADIGDFQSPHTAGGLAGTDRAILGEIVGTFALCSAVLNATCVRRHDQASWFGMAVGFAYAALATAVGPLSGAALNPALGLLGAFASGDNSGGGGNIWIYWVACPIGAILSALFFRFQNADAFSGGGEYALAGKM